MFERVGVDRAARRAARAGDFEKLVALLGDPDPTVRTAEIGDAGVVPAIETLRETERDSEVSKWAKEALEKLRR